MDTLRIRAAEALQPLLSTFQMTQGKKLLDVRLSYFEGSLTDVTLDFDSLSLIIKADPTDDTIEVESQQPSSSGHSQVQPPWSSLIGKQFAFGWVTINHQGYCDGVLLSFKDFVPQIALTVSASSIKIGVIT